MPAEGCHGQEEGTIPFPVPEPGPVFRSRLIYTYVKLFPSPSPKEPMAIYSGNYKVEKGKYPSPGCNQNQNCVLGLSAEPSLAASSSQWMLDAAE